MEGRNSFFESAPVSTKPHFRNEILAEPSVRMKDTDHECLQNRKKPENRSLTSNKNNQCGQQLQWHQSKNAIKSHQPHLNQQNGS